VSIGGRKAGGDRHRVHRVDDVQGVTVSPDQIRIDPELGGRLLVEKGPQWLGIDSWQWQIAQRGSPGYQIVPLAPIGDAKGGGALHPLLNLEAEGLESVYQE